MAEPLSIVASIASVVTLAARTAKLITSITQELKGRKAELVSIGEEVSSFCLVLNDLQSQLDNNSSKSELKSVESDDASAAATRNRGLETLLAGCARTLQSIQNLLGEIKDGHAKSGLGKIQAQLKYSSKKKSLDGLRALLDRYKGSLHIALLVEKASVLSISELRDDLRQAFEVIRTLQAGPGVIPCAGGNENQDPDSEILRDYVHSSAKVLAESVGKKNSASTTVTAPSSEDVFYGSFDEWLASFVPSDARGDELETPAQRLGFTREKRLEMEEATSTPKKTKVMQLQIYGLRKKGSTARHSERIEVDPDTMTFDLLETLFKKGYTEICGFRSQETGMHFGPVTGSRAPYVVSITTGPSSFDPVSGFKINQHQKFIQYYNDYTTQSLRSGLDGWIEEDKIVATSRGFRVFRDRAEGSDALVLRDDRTGEHIPSTYISFRRTLRLPENNNGRKGEIHAEEEHSGTELPAPMSAFPLFSVSSPSVRLGEEMVKMGGVFFPMFQREALSICFRGDGPTEPVIKSKKWVSDYDFSENYAVRIYTGAINVVSGQRGGGRGASGDMQQDFVVIPGQERLDGFYTGDGRIRQFVAMPMGKGYGVEHQLTGEEVVGGIQLEIAPRYKTSVHFARVKTSCAGGGRINVANEEALDVPMDLFLTPSEAGLMVGDVLLMQPLVDDCCQTTRDLMYKPGMTFPEREFFGTATGQYGNLFWSGLRPTFLREVLAWMPTDKSSDRAIQVEVVTPLSVPISWNRRGGGHGRTRIRLSPFLDARVQLDVSVLPQEAISNLPKKDWDYTEIQWAGMDSNLEQESESPCYMPLYSLSKEDISLILRPLHQHWPCGPLVMSLGVGATRKQRIVESADKRLFAWEKSVVVHVHILNSVAFASATGLKPLPCPISWGQYTAAHLPFYKVDLEGAGSDGARAEGEDTALSLARSVQELDIDAGVVWDVVLQVGSKAQPTGCAFCETSLADTFLRPCNHVFCSACIKQWMMQNDGNMIKCAFCDSAIKPEDMVTFSGPTTTAQAPIMGDRHPVSLEIHQVLYSLSRHVGIIERGPELTLEKLGQTPADVFVQLTGWGRSYFEFGAKDLTDTLCKSIELADNPCIQDMRGRYATCTHPFDFILANLWRLPKDTLLEYEDGRLLLDGLAASAKGKTGYCLDRILPFLPPAHELDSFQPGRLGEILCDSCSYAERQTLKLLEWACRDGQATPDDWGMTVASAIWRASPAVVRKMLELGADPNATSDDPDDPRFGQGKSALHQVHDDVVENLTVLLNIGGERMDLQVRDFNGRTPIHSAAEKGMSDTLCVLLEQPGAKEMVDWKDEGGQTALGLLRKTLYGGLAKKAEAERILIEAGADPELALVVVGDLNEAGLGSSLSLNFFT